MPSDLESHQDSGSHLRFIRRLSSPSLRLDFMKVCSASTAKRSAVPPYSQDGWGAETSMSITQRMERTGYFIANWFAFLNISEVLQWQNDRACQ